MGGTSGFGMGVGINEITATTKAKVVDSVVLADEGLAISLRRAEFFGLWGLAVKLSSIIGPITYGLVSWISQGDHRLAMLITGVYFIIGLLILMGINVKRGRQAALADKAIH